MAAAFPYAVREGRPTEDKSAVLDLWRGNLGDASRLLWKYDWFYEQSPLGPPLTLLLEWRAPDVESLRPVGVATAGRRRFFKGEETLEAGVLVDLAVLPEHRTLGPALVLQKALRNEGLTRAALLYGFPNAKAAPVFQRAGYRKIGMMRRYVKVLRPSAYLRRRLPALLAAPLGVLADALTRVRLELAALPGPTLRWTGVDVPVPYGSSDRGSTLLRGERTAAFVAWRFAAEAQPGRVQRVAFANDTGWIVEQQADLLIIRDCSPSLLQPAFATAWQVLFRDCARRGATRVDFECLAPESLQRRLAELGWSARSERPAFAAGDADADTDWFLTSADEDE
jgi:hypothetical protein